jgi:predicted MFS family arabinose efflux permease
MTRFERIVTLNLAGLFSLRLLGLFMILPVFSPYALTLTGATPALIGMTLGIYGLTQAFLQIPFGFASDRIGRKPLILLGLVLFILGSLIAALSTSIYGMMLGRALQGAAAIGSVILALLVDLVGPEKRSQSMAIVGIMIALSFALSLMLGPVFSSLLGVTGLFWISALLGLVGLFILYWSIPTPTASIGQTIVPAKTVFKSLLSNRDLLQLDAGIFILHAILTALFVVLPLLLMNELGLNPKYEWQLYLPVIFTAFLFALPLLRLAEKKQKTRQLFLLSIIGLGLSLLGFLVLPLSLPLAGCLLALFFTAFTVLEASLPSMVSKLAPPACKGTALGIYSTLQFLGIFTGGFVAGLLFTQTDFHQVFAFCLGSVLIWLLIVTIVDPTIQTVN